MGISKIGETTPFEQNFVLTASILSNLGEWNGIISPSRNIWEKLQEQPAVISLQYTLKKGNAFNYCMKLLQLVMQSVSTSSQNWATISKTHLLSLNGESYHHNVTEIRQVAGRSKRCISSVGRDAWKGTSSRRDKLFIVGRIFPMFLHLQQATQRWKSCDAAKTIHE